MSRRFNAMLGLSIAFSLLGIPARAGDLSSSAPSMTAPGSAVILVNGQPQPIQEGQQITYAQYVALNQVLNAGQQTLTVGSSNTAVGGSFMVNAQTPLSGLVVPQGVTGFSVFSNASNLNLAGNLNNYGTFYAVSTNPLMTNANIHADNIFNNPGALLSSVVPANTFNNAISNLNLSLSAISNIINAGTISSAANLDINAGNSVINSGGQIVSTQGNLNVAASSITNSGVLQSLIGDVTLRNLNGPALAINNNNGLISAGGHLLADVSATFGKPNLDITGGVLQGQNVTLRTDDGHLNVSVLDVVGPLNIASGTANIAVTDSSNGLVINSFQITGDPNLTFCCTGDFVSPAFNSDGGFVNIDTSGGPTPGSITFTGDIVTTPTLVGPGGNVTLTAGTFVDVQGINTTGNGGASGSVTITANGNVSTRQITAPGATVSVSTTAGGITLSAPGTWNLGDTNFILNAPGTSTVESFAGNLVVGVGTITNLSSGLLALQAPAGSVDLRAAITAGGLVVDSLGPVTITGNNVNMAATGTLNLQAVGNLGGSFLTGTRIQGLAGGVNFPAGGLTINFLGNGGEIHDLSAVGNFAGIGGTNLTINSAGDIYFRSTDFNNVGGSMTLSVPTSAFYVAQFDQVGTSLNRYSNISLNGGAMGFFSDGTIQFNGSIATTNPGTPGGGGIVAFSGVGCVNCPNTQTGIVVQPGASVSADRGPIVFTVFGTDTNTPADPSRPLINIAAGSTVTSTGGWVAGAPQGGAIQLSVLQLPSQPVMTSLAANRPTEVLADMGNGYVQFLPGAVQSAPNSISVGFPSGSGGTIQASGNGMVQVNDNGLTSLMGGTTGNINANGGFIFIGGASYPGEIIVNGTVGANLPFTQTPPAPTPTDPTPVVTPPTLIVDVIVGIPPSFEPPRLLNQTGSLMFDVTRNTASTVPNTAPSTLQQSTTTALAPNSGTIIAVACQRFIIERNDEDDSFVVADRGTRFSRSANVSSDGADELQLDEGKLMTLAGENGLNVQTSQGVVNLPAGSGALVERSAHGGVAITNIFGSSTSITLDGKKIDVNDGEQLVIADNDEELIPSDYASEVTATITVATKVVQTRKFDRKKFLEQERLMVCATGSDTRELNANLRKKINRVIAHQNALRGATSEAEKAPAKPGSGQNPLRGVAYATPVKTAPSGALSRAEAATAQLRTLDTSVYEELSDGAISLQSGELLVYSTKPTSVHVGKLSLAISPNTIALVERKGDIVKVANVWEKRAGSVRGILGAQFVDLAAGRELIVAPTTRDSSRAMSAKEVGRRRIRETNIQGSVVDTADVSIHSLLRADDLLQKVVRSSDKGDRVVAERMIKMAAVLLVATGGRGKYESAATSK